jgi:DNA-binding HxlR family transcriptional regulator
MAAKLPRRSVCPVACALDIVGDRWTLLVVRDLFCGKSQFKEFRASPEGIASNILSDRLAKLERHGLVERVPLPAIGKDAYQLTQRGRSLEPLLEQITAWGLAQVKGTRALMRERAET